ncbi:hypothetical protein JG688_00014616 [Phytophthora aleatoria]|uniref:Uncharacterized protein n=1 Tax=Phytophthora aleatoria TaxID=2496075 RepID=A0A8J5IFP5_9STRA|nr:hypothetical protein JG688_00014616 [Phytophthora aleatoria]
MGYMWRRSAGVDCYLGQIRQSLEPRLKSISTECQCTFQVHSAECRRLASFTTYCKKSVLER